MSCPTVLGVDNFHSLYKFATTLERNTHPPKKKEEGIFSTFFAFPTLVASREAFCRTKMAPPSSTNGFGTF
jgi:hypothetical protein